MIEDAQAAALRLWSTDRRFKLLVGVSALSTALWIAGLALPLFSGGGYQPPVSQSSVTPTPSPLPGGPAPQVSGKGPGTYVSSPPTQGSGHQVSGPTATGAAQPSGGVTPKLGKPSGGDGVGVEILPTMPGGLMPSGGVQR